MRFTEKVLREHVDELNEELAAVGAPKRFEHSPRNGYQAVDLYTVLPTGQRQHSGVDCNVACGTPREVASEVTIRYYQIVNQLLKG